MTCNKIIFLHTSVGSYTALTKDKLIYWCVMTMDKINNLYRGHILDLNSCHLNFWSDREPTGFTIVHFSWICLSFLSGRFEIKNVLLKFVKLTKIFEKFQFLFGMKNPWWSWQNSTRNTLWVGFGKVCYELLVRYL